MEPIILVLLNPPSHLEIGAAMTLKNPVLNQNMSGFIKDLTTFAILRNVSQSILYKSSVHCDLKFKAEVDIVQLINDDFY